MWVRSQDKKSRLKAKEIRIETEMVKKYIDENELLSYKSEDVHIDVLFGEMNIASLKPECRYYVYQTIGYIVVNDKRIARYSTEEKALKVLDMIDEHLDNQSKIVEKSMGEYIISNRNSIIFQMPQDIEVE